MQNLKLKVRNTLLGISFGDALGMPTENFSKGQIKKIFGKVNTFLPSPEFGPIKRQLRAGEITDDTQNSIFICEMLINNKGIVSPEIFVEYLINWFDTDEKSQFVAGPSTIKAIKAIKRGVSYHESGIEGTTNGAAMKIAPLGMLFTYKKLSELVENVVAICLPTHNTQIAIQGAVVIATAVSYCFRNDKIDWEDFYQLIYDSLSRSENYGTKTATPSLYKRLTYGKYIAKHFNEEHFKDELYSFMGTGLETIEMVPAAISLVYRYQGNLKHTVQIAANIGGDTDTLGAICGSICGNCNFNLEKKEIDLLTQVNKIDYDKISQELSKLIIVEERKNADRKV